MKGTPVGASFMRALSTKHKATTLNAPQPAFSAGPPRLVRNGNVVLAQPKPLELREDQPLPEFTKKRATRTSIARSTVEPFVTAQAVMHEIVTMSDPDDPEVLILSRLIAN